MNEGEKPQFAQSMTAVGEIYGREISEIMVGIYWNALKNYEMTDVQKAFQGHTRDTDNGQFFPKPADLIRHIDGNKDGKALRAWSKAYQAIRRYGRRNSVVFDDALIHAVIEDMGGWIDFAGMSEEDAPFRAREFEKRYRSGLLTGVGNYLPVLIGMDDAHNILGGFQEKPAPFFMGDTARCQLVLSGVPALELKGVA